jgi:hypothetical protein
MAYAYEKVVTISMLATPLAPPVAEGDQPQSPNSTHTVRPKPRQSERRHEVGRPTR